MNLKISDIYAIFSLVVKEFNVFGEQNNLLPWCVRVKMCKDVCRCVKMCKDVCVDVCVCMLSHVFILHVLTSFFFLFQLLHRGLRKLLKVKS